jgi:hypothetical protein
MDAPSGESKSQLHRPHRDKDFAVGAVLHAQLLTLCAFATR